MRPHEAEAPGILKRRYVGRERALRGHSSLQRWCKTQKTRGLGQRISLESLQLAGTLTQLMNVIF